MYGKYLAHQLPLYLITGILCSVLLGVNVTVMKYNRSMGEIIEKVRTLAFKKVQMMKNRDEVEGRIKSFVSMKPERFTETPGEEFILKAVDNLRTKMKGDSLVVTNFRKEPSQRSLPVELSFRFESYPQMLQRLYDLENMAFPFFKFTSFTFHKEQPVSALCRIRGDIVIPVVGGGK